MARILVAEDDDISQQVVRAALQTAGFAVDIVEDGAEAISAVQARAYDLVLMDIQMPNVDGIAASSLAALPAGAHLHGELGAAWRSSAPPSGHRPAGKPIVSPRCLGAVGSRGGTVWPITNHLKAWQSFVPPQPGTNT